MRCGRKLHTIWKSRRVSRAWTIFNSEYRAVDTSFYRDVVARRLRLSHPKTKVSSGSTGPPISRAVSYGLGFHQDLCTRSRVWHVRVPAACYLLPHSHATHFVASPCLCLDMGPPGREAPGNLLVAVGITEYDTCPLLLPHPKQSGKLAVVQQPHFQLQWHKVQQMVGIGKKYE